MRITGFHVDGFGLLHDQAVADAPPGTIVVLGPNEAGKSTLHAFLVRTLFGHPRANDAEGRHRHEPLAGGRHGGVVHCEDEDGGRWEVHRHTEGTPRLRVVAPDGSESTGTDAVLELLGRTVDDARYEQVFAIDLDDLAGVGSLGQGALDDLLFDAATVGTGRSLRAARDEAVERRDALWTPTSTKRPLAAAVRRRADARAALAAAQDAARANLDLRRRLDDAARRVDELAGLQQEQAARIALLERVADAWPAWARTRELDDELEHRPDPALDDGAVTAAREAVADADAAGRTLDDLRRRRSELAAAIERIEVDPAVLAVADEVEQLADRLGAHELAVEQLAAAEQVRDAADRALGAAMAELGPGWDRHRVATVPSDAPTRQRLEAAGTDLLEAGRAAHEAAERAETAAGLAARRRRQVAEHEAAVPEAPDEAVVADREEAVAVLRTGVPTLERADLLGGRETAGAGPPWLAGVLLGLALVAAVATAVGAVPGPVGTVVAVVFAGLGAFLLGRDRATAAAPSAGGGPLDHRDGVARLASEVADAAARLDLHPHPSTAEVERAAGGIAADRTRVREAAEARRALAAVRVEADEAAAAARERADVADSRAAREAAAAETWRKVCDEVGLDPDEDVRVALARHGRLAAARRAQDDLAAARADVERQAARVRDHCADVSDVSARAGVVAEGAAAVRGLPALRDRARAARAADRERAGLRQQLDVLDEEIRAAEERQATASAACDEALGAVGATGAADLEELVIMADHRRSLELERDRTRGEVDRLLGAGPRGQEGRALLVSADPAAWEQELVAATATATALRADRDAAVARRTELESALRDLGGDDAVPRAEQELAAAEHEVAQLAERWAVADTAARLLEETVARFERDQQPRVLTRASDLLARATGGQWVQVRRLDDQVVVARSAGGDPVPATVLSRGTREQLWLCLRLALAEDLSRDRPLPLLVDDLLGTSDPERSLHVARVLAEVARRQQVWLFTCHPRTAELVTSTDPTAGVLRLRRGGRVVGLDRRDHPSDDPTHDAAPRLDLA